MALVTGMHFGTTSRPSPRIGSRLGWTGSRSPGEASDWVGVERIQMGPSRKWSTPLHLEGSEEEIFYVLGGTGVSVQADGANACACWRHRPGDCLVHLAACWCTPLRAQAGPRRSGRARLRPAPLASGAAVAARGCLVARLATLGSSREARTTTPGSVIAGMRPPSVEELSERPARGRGCRGRRADVAGRGHRRAHGPQPGPGGGLLQDRASTVRGAAGEALNPPQSASAEEEVDSVLDGTGALELWPHLRFGGERGTHEPTGNVGVDLGSQSITTSGTYYSSTATVTAAGRYCFRAEFTSTSTGVPGSSDSRANECFTVAPVQPTLTTDATDSPVAFGQAISDSVTLSGTAHEPGTGGPTGDSGSINPTTLGGDATGDIIVKAYGPDTCSRLVPRRTPSLCERRRYLRRFRNGVRGHAGPRLARASTSSSRRHVRGRLANTLGITASACLAAPMRKGHRHQQIATDVMTKQSWYPNDTATVSAVRAPP